MHGAHTRLCIEAGQKTQVPIREMHSSRLPSLGVLALLLLAAEAQGAGSGLGLKLDRDLSAPTLTGDERLQQLCDLEALSQLCAWNAMLRPDRLVAYAMGEARLAGDLLSADGAAFHNDAGWWRLRYRCGLTPDHLKVASFQFAVGDAIPQSQWQAHSLPTPEGADPD